ncbi:MAG: hypothetical protein N3B10_15755 [Armatimonadetes bacterium]|nr:hypothetical protein [Armatimonadota bacterium]
MVAKQLQTQLTPSPNEVGINDDKNQRRKILTVFCIFDDIIKALKMQVDKQQQMSDSEVLTFACIAHQYFGSNCQATLSFFKPIDQPLFLRIPSKSPFTVRIHCFLDFPPTSKFVGALHSWGWL